MKRFTAHALSLLVLFACFAPAIAVAKSRHHAPAKANRAAAVAKKEAAVPPPLPDRNPNRTASGDPVTPQTVAVPQTISVTPQAVAGDATTTGSVGLSAGTVAPSDALAAAQVLTPPDRNPKAVATPSPAVPDRNPNAPGAEEVAAATTTVNPTSDQAAHVSIVPLPDRNPTAGAPVLAAAEEISLLPHSASLVPPTTARAAASGTSRTNSCSICTSRGC